MSKYSDNDLKKEKGESIPHPQARENFEWCMRQIGKCDFTLNQKDALVTAGSEPDRKSSLLTYEIQDTKIGSVYDHSLRQYIHTYAYPDPKCIIFIWPEKGEKFTECVSFHQNARTEGQKLGFKEQVCNCLNYFGEKKLLTHKLKTNDGKLRSHKQSATDPDDKWGMLFGQ